MGYYTWFSMKAKHIKSKEEYEKIVETLKMNEIYAHDDVYGIFESSEYFEDCGEAIFSVCDEHKWYEHTYDMMKISKIFPDVISDLAVMVKNEKIHGMNIFITEKQKNAMLK